VVGGPHAEGLAPGDLVRSELGWREAFVAPARAVQRVDPPPGVPEAHLLGALGMPGLTAWVGLNDIAGVRAGETVFVSAAAGAVGSVAGQLARERGCIVIGSAGTPEKVAYVREELGFHHAFSYRDEDPAEALAAVAPDGIDVYFDNVGGAQLEAALGAMRLHGRIVLCGAVAHYNDTEPAPGPRNLFRAVTQRLTLRGFIVRDHWDREAAFRAELDPLVAAGRLELPQAMVDGIERAPQALVAMLRGEHVGKVVVRLPGTSAR